MGSDESFHNHCHEILSLFLLCVCQLPSRVLLFATPYTVAHQAPLAVGFSRQEYWSGQSFSSPGDLPDPGIKTQVSCINECKYRLVLFFFPMYVKKNITFAAQGVFLNVLMVFMYKCGISNFVCSVLLNDLDGLILT